MIRTPAIVGHRGSPRRCAENTVASVRRALMEGAAAVEVDMCRTHDGRLVLWRDVDPNEHAALKRQAGLVDLYAVPEVPRLGSPRRRTVGDLDLGEMRQAYAYHRRAGILSEVLGLRRGRRIPFETLEDLLSAAPGLPGLQDLYLDLRMDASLAPEIFRLAARLAHFVASTKAGGSLGFHLMSPHPEVVAVAQEASARGPVTLMPYLHLVRPGFLESARRFRARRVTCREGGRTWQAFRSDLRRILEARDRGEIERVVVWTVNDREHLEELFEWGPDAVLTDDIPAALRLSRPEVRETGREIVAGMTDEPEGALTVG